MYIEDHVGLRVNFIFVYGILLGGTSKSRKLVVEFYVLRPPKYEKTLDKSCEMS